LLFFENSKKWETSVVKRNAVKSIKRRGKICVRSVRRGARNVKGDKGGD